MNTASTLIQAGGRTVAKARRRTALRLPDREILGSPARRKLGGIQWPADEQMRDVSRKLTHICLEGKCREGAGVCFQSGDLAFPMQEIIRATTRAFEESRRAKHQRAGHSGTSR